MLSGRAGDKERPAGRARPGRADAVECGSEGFRVAGKAEEGTDGLRKEALYSGSRMSSRLAAKQPISAPDNDAPLPSFLRRKKFQGKAEPGGQI